MASDRASAVDARNAGNSSLATHAVKGVAWNWSGAVVLAVVQIASTAATARLVAPREFGLYAAAQTVGALAGFFCLRAVGQELQRRPELGPRSVGTAMTIVLTASTVVSGCVIFGAWAWAAAWGVPDAAWSIRVFGIALLLQSAAVVPLALLRRELLFGRAAVLETTAIVCGMASGVVLAIQLHSALALALGQALGAAVLLIATSAASGKRLIPSFDRAEARGMTTFAGQVGGLNLMSFVSIALPNWFVARVFGASTLGVFSRAQLMAEIPAEYAGTGIYRVIYPLYGRVRRDRSRTRTLLVEAMTLTAGLVWPAFGLLAGAAPLVVSIVLGPQWEEAAPYLALFSLGVCAAIPTGLLTNFAEAFGWMRLIALRQAVYLGGIGIVLISAYGSDVGVEGVLVGVAIAQWITYGTILVLFVKRDLLSVRAIAASQGSHAATALGAFAIGTLCTVVARSASIDMQLIAVAVGALLTLGLVAACAIVLPAGRTVRRRLAQAVPMLATAGIKEKLRRTGVTRLMWRRKATVLRSYGLKPSDHLRYLLADPELNNFTYDIANRAVLRQWLDCNVGVGTGRFVDELDRDAELRRELARRLRWRPDAKFQHFGRRLGWYAVVRARKPSIVVETGIHNGLGSTAILAALARNAEDGKGGRLISIDPREGSGWLVPQRLEGRWEVVRSTSVDALPGQLSGRKPEMFIHDSDHSVECETWELQLAAELGASALLSDNSHASSVLESIAHERHIHYALFREQPVHWYPGGGIGIALVKDDHG